MPTTVIPETGVNAAGLPAAKLSDVEGVFDTVIAAVAATYYLQTNPSGYQTAAQVAALIAAGAYTLPTGTNSILGGVKPDGTTLTNTAGAISVAYGTTGTTAAVGNDSRITGALAASTAAATYYLQTNPTGYQTAAQVAAALPVASSTTPLIDGTATIGVGTTFARADHIHPTDTTRYAAANPTGYQTAAQVAAAITAAAYSLPTASTTVSGGVKVDGTSVTIAAGVISVPGAGVVLSSTNPAMNGTVAVGVGTTAARADHVHASDTSRAPLANPTFSAGVFETRVAMAALNLDMQAGSFFTKTLTVGSTFTVSNVPAAGVSASVILELTNGGAFAITWWSGMKWAAASAPTLTASGIDVLGFYTLDGGTTWRGLLLGKGMA
jgi:hypothetical protein